MDSREETQVRRIQDIVSNLLSKDEAREKSLNYQDQDHISRKEWTDSEIEEAIVLYISADVPDEKYLEILNKHSIKVSETDIRRSSKNAIRNVFNRVVCNKLLWSRRNLTGTNYTSNNAGLVSDKWGLFRKGYIKFSDLVMHVMRYRDSLGIENVHDAIDYVEQCLNKIYKFDVSPRN